MSVAGRTNEALGAQWLGGGGKSWSQSGLGLGEFVSKLLSASVEMGALAVPQTPTRYTLLPSMGCCQDENDHF